MIGRVDSSSAIGARNMATSDLSVTPKRDADTAQVRTTNTKECMVKDTDPKPKPKCVLCKGQTPTDPTRSTATVTKGMTASPSTMGGDIIDMADDMADDPSPSLNPSRIHSYDLRRSIQPSGRVREDEWQTTYRRRRTTSPRKNPRERSTSPRGSQSHRQVLAERSTNRGNTRRAAQNKTTAGETVQTLEHFFQLTPSQQ
jgi:hypothetical protein